MSTTEKLVMDHPMDSLLDLVSEAQVGQGVSRIDGPLKVSGQATYTAEYPMDGLLYGYLVSATIGKGKIKTIHDKTALVVHGVVAVITDFKRFLRNPQQGGVNLAPIQGVKEIAYFGQPIALVVAESYEAARAGAAALKVDYERADDGAFDLIKELKNRKPIDWITDKSEISGDPEESLLTADIKVDRVYITPSQNSAAMELHASVAYWEGHDLIIYSSLQMVASCRASLAHALGLNPKHVRLISRFVGGGFGSKLGISSESVAAAIAAKQLKRPVKVVMTRPQVFESTVRRSNTRQRIGLGADANGKIHTIIHNSIVTNLSGELFFEPTALATHFLYQGKNREVKYEMVRMNQVLAGSMRAPGEAVGLLALECAIDELAELVKIDPIELRKLNEPERDPSKDIPFSSRHLIEALETGANHFGWKMRSSIPANRREGQWLIGMGVASAARSNSLKPSEARVTLTPEIKVIVETDMTDIGTGTYTVLAQITADLLGVPLSVIEVRLGDSDFPPSAGSGGSWGASSSGSSVYLACKKIREQLAAQSNIPIEELDLKDGHISSLNGSKSLKELVTKDIVGIGKIDAGKTSKKYTQASFGAHFAEVAVNAVTGEIRVKRMLGIFTAGRILNEKTARSQCYGGMVFGLGAALMENLQHDSRDGRITNHNLAEYHIPTNADVPDIEVILLPETDRLTNPLHAKGIGELGIAGAGAAIANAVYNATGIRVYDYPITLDKLLDRLPSL
ncbi:MAG: xanthine dehydrogenase family protein molybdopterin-binding subunit [Candidatus Saccharibacteria bacterium]|nr:xanthine dehydrogenase family protein molybdopterin-binding subunit [Moraxellaceae bacterium]